MFEAVFSFVVDNNEKYIRQAAHLAQSVARHTKGWRCRIYAQVTPEVGPLPRSFLESLGCEVRQLQRFGDGRYCNKLNQFEALKELEYDYAILLDADMLVIGDLGLLLAGDRLRGRIVGAGNPSRAALDAIALSSNLKALPPLRKADCTGEETYAGNLNGGLYVVPRRMASLLERSWKRWTQWILENRDELCKEGKVHHADQVGMWLAIHHENIPYTEIAANW